MGQAVNMRVLTFDLGSYMLACFWGCVTSCLILPLGWAVHMCSGLPALGRGCMCSVFAEVLCMLTWAVFSLSQSSVHIPVKLPFCVLVCMLELIRPNPEILSGSCWLPASSVSSYWETAFPWCWLWPITILERQFNNCLTTWYSWLQDQGVLSVLLTSDYLL